MNICCVVIVMVCGASCASPERASQSDSNTPTQADAERIFREMLERDATRDALVVEARARIDDGPLDGACAQRAELPFEDARTAWLHSWCAWHMARWQELLDVSPRALDYAELAGQGRRAIEIRLMRAHAARMLARPALVEQELDVASQWLVMTREKLPGGLTDPFPGDLPFLLAMHVSQGEELRLFRSKVPLDAARLFEAAQFDYARHQTDGALTMSLREHATSMLERGDVASASALVRRALLLDLDRGHERATARDLEVVALMADALGRPALATRLLEHLIVAGQLPRVELPGEEALPASAEELEAMATHHQGRRQLLLWLRSNRRDESTRRIKARLLALYAQFDQIEQRFSTWSYELVAQVGQAFAERGERELARRFFGAAVSMLEAVRGDLGSLHVRQDFSRTWRDPYMALIHQKVGIDTDRLPQKDYQEAAALIGALKARGLRDMLEGRALTPYKEVREVEAIAALPSRLEGEERGLIEDTLQALSMWGMRAAETRHVSGYPLDDLDAYYGVERLADLVPEGGVALEYVLGERSGYVIVVGADGRMVTRQVAGRREVGPLFEEFRATLLDPEFSTDVAAQHRALAERLYVALIAPIQDLIVDSERLYIAPDAMLHDLPFEALARPSLDATPEYLFMTHTASYVPSLHVWGLLDGNQTGMPDSKEVLLVGAPELAASSLDLLTLSSTLPGDGLQGMGELFDDLPGSREELDAISEALKPRGFEVEMLHGEHATEHALRTRESGALAIMHIATHGLSDARPWNAELEGSFGMQQPALLLGQQGVHDGLWRLDEVLEFESRARLVVLSGCTTGRGWRALGDGAYGLAGAFLFAGNQRVVASSWSVSDEETGELMAHMYTRLDAELDAAKALNEGRRAWYKKARRRGHTPPPFMWAAFRVLGL